jgi:hypothetical protein
VPCKELLIGLANEREPNRVFGPLYPTELHSKLLNSRVEAVDRMYRLDYSPNLGGRSNLSFGIDGGTVVNWLRGLLRSWIAITICSVSLMGALNVGGRTVVRRIAGLGAVGSVLLVWSSLAASQQSIEDVRRLMNNMHYDMSTCVAYFRVVSRCAANSSQSSHLAEPNEKASDFLLQQAYELAQEIGMTEDALNSRLAMAAEDMLELMNKNCINISSVMSRHQKKCTAIAADPLKPLKDALR